MLFRAIKSKKFILFSHENKAFRNHERGKKRKNGGKQIRQNRKNTFDSVFSTDRK